MTAEAKRPAPAGLFLVGPTASGKTAVAHALAGRLGLPVLSADAMLVYRGMDVGTAKPSARERKRYGYEGIDLADPDEPFSVGRYLEAVRAAVARAASPRWIVAGGTGLYVKGLAEGLDPSGAASRRARAAVRQQYEAGGLEALRAELERRAPGALAGLADRDNPRRVQRALERVLDGARAAPRARGAARPRLVGLERAPSDLRERIAGRVEAMFAGGLIEEAANLRRRYGELSPTARGAIGYREAAGVLDGRCTAVEAKERMVVRTRQLAKRQRTWFRHQADVAWVPVAAGTAAGRIADEVERTWRECGSTAFAFG